MKAIIVHESRFTLDGLEEYFLGYTNGQLWNGWACPYFDEKTTIEILEKMKSYGHIQEYCFWDTADIPYFEIRLPFEDCESEIFEQVEINYGGKPIKAYALGFFSWTWLDIDFEDLNNYRKQNN